MSWNLNIHASYQGTPAFPTNTQLNAPTINIPGATVYDYRFGKFVSVDEYDHGNRDLKKEVENTLLIESMLSAKIFGVSSTFQVSYSASQNRKPIVSFLEPSPELELALPDRFVRDGAGRLETVDTSAFNADRSETRKISGNIQINGTVARQPGSDIRAYVKTDILRWDASLGADYTISDKLKITEFSMPINILRNPLSISNNPPSKFAFRAMFGFGKRDYGFNASVNFKGPSTASSQSGDSGVRANGLAIIGATVFRDISVGGSASGTKHVRIRLSVDNIMNSRREVHTRYMQIETRVNPWEIDPDGRVLKGSAFIVF